MGSGCREARKASRSGGTAGEPGNRIHHHLHCLRYLTYHANGPLRCPGGRETALRIHNLEPTPKLKMHFQDSSAYPPYCYGTGMQYTRLLATLTPSFHLRCSRPRHSCTDVLGLSVRALPVPVWKIKSLIPASEPALLTGK